MRSVALAATLSVIKEGRMSICMRCGGECTCNRHGKVPEELFYLCCKDLKYPVDHKGKTMEAIRKILDDLVKGD